MVKRIKRGLEVNDDTLGLTAIKEAGRGGHFLDKDHTLKHFRGEFYQPALSNRDDFDGWYAKGCPQSVDLHGNIHLLMHKGFSAREVIKELDPKNDRLIRWITIGNVSFANMVRSAINATA